MGKKPKPVKVTAHLASPLSGDAPQLDALMEYVAAQDAPRILEAAGKEVPDDVIRPVMDRGSDPPPPGMLPIPIVRRDVDGWPVACCSSPILGEVVEEYSEYKNKRLDIGETGRHLSEDARRKSIHYGTGHTKAYHRPVRARVVQRVVWFALAVGFSKGKGKTRSPQGEMRRWLKEIPAIGSDRQAGYGRVEEWKAETTEVEAWWWADQAGTPVLMRCLPASAARDDSVGGRLSRAAVCPPYWHPQRHVEAIVPC